MSRYIDADAFIDDLYEHEFSNWCDKDEVSTLVNEAPTIDIVNCRECKKAHTEDCSLSYWDDDYVEWVVPYIGDGWYCADGEREGE